ncbi:MAG: peptidylprolyl isomerase [Flavobacteriaceae bacterium]|nr:peptidylprolyl isomerase [Flavobacteriaceae bacterium]|tara:strand:+ start:22852 stop:24321 length:1470 start_codon:yes stop_codon:yes gene_type:complete
MQLRIKVLKFTPKNNLLWACFAIASFQGLNAQEIVVDSTNAISETVVNTPKNDSVKPFEKFKAEGVTAVVGEYVILDSDIDKSYLELQQQNIPTEEISRCQLLGKLMEDKLYAHQAKIDSLEVSDVEITQRIEQQIAYIISEFGGDEDKVAKFYKKDNIDELKQELFNTNKTLMLASRMQQKVVEDVEVTPEEVRQFFFSIPEDERPVFSAEVEVAQIIVEPQITEEARKKVIDRLNEFRQDIVENGASFATKAVLYSKDGSAAKGGLIEGIRKSSPLAKEFKDVAFSLLEGEVSEPFETEFGFHIVTVDKIRGQELDVRHIILFPEVSQETLDKAKFQIDSLRTEIVSGNISFEEAARRYSDEEETRNNGGVLVNPVSLDTRFDLTKMDPVLGAQVYNLEEGDVSKVLTDRDRTGKVNFKILTVTHKYKEHEADFQKDYEKIKELALKEKQIKAIGEWQNKKIKDTYINVNQDYYDCEFSSDWIKSNQ